MNITDWPQDVKDTVQRACNNMFSGHRELYFADLCRLIMDERMRCWAHVAADIEYGESPQHSRQAILNGVPMNPEEVPG